MWKGGRGVEGGEVKGVARGEGGKVLGEHWERGRGLG